MITTPCMGGWCLKRQHCAHYHSEAQVEPEERLCLPGRDGERNGWPAHLMQHPSNPSGDFAQHQES